VDKLKKDASQGMMGQHGVNDVATDSWEAGFQNWTDGTVNGHWRVEFQAGRGVPNSAEFKEPSERSDSSNPGIQYFPGVATYTRKIDFPYGH
jgi:hypothetical protein